MKLHGGILSGFVSLRWLLLLGAALLAGFAFAALLMQAPTAALQFRQKAAQSYRDSEVAHFISYDRVGRMEQAPAYLTCANTIDYYRRRRTTAELDPRLIRNIVRRNSSSVSYAATVGPFLICVLDHNPFNVCDRDNRALAIEGINRYLRATDAIKAEVEAKPLWTVPVKTGEVLRQRERVLALVREHARDGRLTRRDFGLNQHAEIIQIYEAIAPAGDRCAKR